MSQQINLFNPQFEQQRNLLSARTMAGAAPALVDPGTTAIWEMRLDDVVVGKADFRAVIDEMLASKSYPDAPGSNFALCLSRVRIQKWQHHIAEDSGAWQKIE